MVLVFGWRQEGKGFPGKGGLHCTCSRNALLSSLGTFQGGEGQGEMRVETEAEVRGIPEQQGQPKKSDELFPFLSPRS